MQELARFRIKAVPPWSFASEWGENRRREFLFPRSTSSYSPL